MGLRFWRGNVRFRQTIPAHLSFVLVLGIDVVGRSHFIVNGGSKVHDLVKEDTGRSVSEPW